MNTGHTPTTEHEHAAAIVADFQTIERNTKMLTGYASWREAALSAIVKATEELQKDCDCPRVGSVCDECRSYYEFQMEVFTLLGWDDELPY